MNNYITELSVFSISNSDKYIKSRDDKIRTCGLFVPNEARYRTALHPEYQRAKIHIFLIGDK